MKITNVALENHEVAGKTRGYRPFDIFGDDLLGLLETHVKVRGRLSCDEVFITRTIPVAAEVLLCAMDQRIAENRDALEIVQDKSDSHIYEREWAFKKVLPRLKKLVLFHRGGKKMPRARIERFWNCLFKDVKGMPPYHECLPIFSTMRRFPGSALVSIGLDYLYGKDSLLARIPTEKPSYPAECNPWNIFNHGIRVGFDNDRVADCFKKGAWGRMQEASIIMLGFTEFINGCVYHQLTTSHGRMEEALKTITYEDGEVPLCRVQCGINKFAPDFPKRQWRDAQRLHQESETIHAPHREMLQLCHRQSWSRFEKISPCVRLCI